jgi:putative peptide zinc metalloprotease protein
MASSTGRPLRLCFRKDLVKQRQTYQGRDYWVLKDPITLKYYRFEDEEFALLEMIDGQTSPDQIKREFDYRYAPQKITMRELYQFVGMLYRSGLLISQAANQGVELKRRGEKQQSSERWQSLTNILAIRYRGFDPDRMLGVLDRYVGWFFTWTAFFFVALLGIAAVGLIVAQFELFQNKLPSFYDFFAAKNWFWLAIVLAGTKVLHEFGHGLACKRFGGQCHEMGVMLLVLTPCLYVNVSDSWLLNDKWKRALIAAAGMYVELVLSAIAVFVWWFSTPGLINQLALNVIFVSSVSTILFNANPLLRYDGYYILSDLLEIPNLRTKASTILNRSCGSLFLGIESRPDPFLPKRNQWLFAFYSIAAATYRWVITFSIFWFVYRVLEPYGFKVIGQMIALTSIYGLLGMPLIKLYKFFSVPGRLGVVNRFRATVSAAAFALLIGAAMFVPIPHYVYCDFYTQAAGAENVYVDVPGRLDEILAKENTRVNAGDPIVQLHSHDLRVQVVSLWSESEMAKVRRDNIMRSGSADGANSQGLKTAQAAYDASYASFEKRYRDTDRLTVRSPVSGTLIAPPLVSKSDTSDKTLEQWSGSPLDRKNLGAQLKQSTLIGQVIPDMKKMEAVLAVDQADVDFVKQAQPVEMLINEVPCEIFESQVGLVTPNEMKATPKSLSSKYGGAIVTTTDREGAEVPTSTRYLVKVNFDNEQELVVPGSTGVAKIRAGSQTVGQRIWRMASRTFQFEL